MNNAAIVAWLCQVPFSVLRRQENQDPRTASLVRRLPDRKGSRRDGAHQHIARDRNRLPKLSGIEGALVIELCLTDPHMCG